MLHPHGTFSGTFVVHCGTKQFLHAVPVLVTVGHVTLGPHGAVVVLVSVSVFVRSFCTVTVLVAVRSTVFVSVSTCVLVTVSVR